MSTTSVPVAVSPRARASRKRVEDSRQSRPTTTVRPPLRRTTVPRPRPSNSTTSAVRSSSTRPRMSYSRKITSGTLPKLPVFPTEGRPPEPVHIVLRGDRYDVRGPSLDDVQTSLSGRGGEVGGESGLDLCQRGVRGLVPRPVVEVVAGRGGARLAQRALAVADAAAALGKQPAERVAEAVE